MNNIEKRFVISNLQADNENRIIKGTAIVFNSLSQDLGGFKEIIDPVSVNEELINKSDIVFLFNHSQNQGVLARAKYGKGSLSITINNDGVHFEFVVKNSALGNEVLESIQRGDLEYCSFAFRVKSEKWEKINGENIRTITEFEKLFDFSIVVNPAYDQTSVSARSFEMVKELNNEINIIDPKMTAYYKKLEKEFLYKK